MVSTVSVDILLISLERVKSPLTTTRRKCSDLYTSSWTPEEKMLHDLKRRQDLRPPVYRIPPTALTVQYQSE